MENLKLAFSAILSSIVFSFVIAIPLINLLYKFKITRRMSDFSSIIEARNVKFGVPIMGGLIIIITTVVLNLFFNPVGGNLGLLMLLTIFLVSAILGGIDDILNIYGKPRDNQRPLSRTFRLIKVHKSFKKRIWMILTFPWEIYKRFFFALGSNPGKGIQAHEKILVQFFLGAVLAVSLYFFSSRENPTLIKFPVLDLDLNLGFLFFPFVIITVVLMTNAVNLADGMDSLAGFQLFVALLGFLFIAVSKDDIRVIFLIATLLGSLVSYLYFNIPPARFQMGDVGALALGTLLAGIAFVLDEPLYLLIFGLPFALTLISTVIQSFGRRILGRRIFRMAPWHYHFQMKNGWSEEKVVMRFILLAIFCTILGIYIFLLDKY